MVHPYNDILCSYQEENSRVLNTCKDADTNDNPWTNAPFWGFNYKISIPMGVCSHSVRYILSFLGNNYRAQEPTLLKPKLEEKI